MAGRPPSGGRSVTCRATWDSRLDSGRPALRGAFWFGAESPADPSFGSGAAGPGRRWRRPPARSEQVGAVGRETELVELIGETSGGIGILGNVDRVCRVSSTDSAARLNERIGDLGEDAVEFPGLL